MTGPRPGTRRTGTYAGKRAFDLLISLSILLIASPVMLVLTVLVALIHGRPVLFSQQRPGLEARPFNMLKFRSMSNATDAAGNLLPADQRITPFGAFLRKTSLDELPELFNVVRGEMSIVGPRPLLMDYLNYYTPQQHRRHEAKPGITGLAQINGRNNLSWEDKFVLDVRYVDTASFRLDLSIILKTIFIVLGMRDINQDGVGHRGSEYFRGSPPSGPSSAA